MKPRAPYLVLALVCLVPTTASAGDVEIDGSFVSTLPTGNPPLEVSSTTHVPNLNADLLDGLDVSALMPAMSNVLLVAESGGHFTSIQAALDSITDAASHNPYLILVGPGFFTEQVVMKPYVDIQGSGPEMTTISWSGGDLGNATLRGADNAELRDLRVINNGASLDEAWAIHNLGASPSLRNVTARSISAGLRPTAIRNGVGSSPTLTHVVAHASGPQAKAIHTLGGDPTLTWVRASTFGEDTIAIENAGSASPTMRHVTAVASSSNDDMGLVIGISFVGGVSRLTDVESTATRGQFNRAIFTSGAAVAMTRVTAYAGGNPGSSCFGIFATQSDLRLTDAEVEASECSTANQGVRSDRSDVQIYGSRVTALSATSYGIFNHDAASGGGPCTVRVHNTPVTGGTGAISTQTACTTTIGASLLGGVAQPAGGGTTECAGVYDDNMNLLGSDCTPPP